MLGNFPPLLKPSVPAEGLFIYDSNVDIILFPILSLNKSINLALSKHLFKSLLFLKIKVSLCNMIYYCYAILLV